MLAIKLNEIAQTSHLYKILNVFSENTMKCRL